jgi:hypothetical protein
MTERRSVNRTSRLTVVGEAASPAQGGHDGGKTTEQPTRRIRHGGESFTSAPSAPTCIALFLVGLVVLALRRPDIFTAPKLWAEDGTVFMRDAYLRHGYQALLAPYAGVVLLVPRLWAEFSSVLPVRYLPVSYAVFAVTLDTACVSVILSRRFAWLIPSFWLRAVLFFGLILLPGNWEIYGNLVNSIWYTGLCLLLLSFATDPQTRAGSAAEITVCLLFAFTGGTSFVVAPLFALRWWRTRSRHSAAIFGLVSFGGLYQLVEVRLHPRIPPDLSSVSAWDFLRTFLERVGGTAALGERRLAAWWPSSHAHHHLAALAIAIVLLLAVVILALWLPRQAQLALAAAMALLLGSATFGVLGSFHQLNSPSFSGRYFVAPVALLLLTIAAALPLAWRAIHRNVAWLIFLPVVIVGFGIISDARLTPLPSIGWTASARCIASHRACHVPLNPPPGWYVNLPPVRTAH